MGRCKCGRQCDFPNFWGALQTAARPNTISIQLGLPHPTYCKDAKGAFLHRFALLDQPLSQPILAEGSIALSVRLSGGALFATPIPVKFDRQRHSCNFYAGLGPTDLLLLTNLCTKPFALQNTSPKVMQKATHTQHKHC